MEIGAASYNWIWDYVWDDFSLDMDKCRREFLDQETREGGGSFLRTSGSFIVDGDGSSWGFIHYTGRRVQIGDPAISEDLQRAEVVHICMDGWVSDGSG